MIYLDEYKNNFGRWGSKYVERHLEDPTWLGFTIRFKFDEEGENNFFDYVPGGLLYTDIKISPEDWIPLDGGELEDIITSESPYSALNYIQTQVSLYGESSRWFYRSRLIRNLIKELIYVQNKTPWFFQSISGLDSAYKINREGFRTGNEAKITINTLESIDKRIQFIIDAYRTLAWDYNTMSWVLPENLRKFQMEIILTEFNTIHTKDNAYLESTESFTDFTKFLDNYFPNAYNTLTKGKQKIRMVKDLVKSLNLPLDALEELFVLDYFNDVTVQVIQLGGCELDVIGDYAPNYLGDISMADAGEQLTNSLPIKFNRVNIINHHSLLEYLFDEKNGLIMANYRQEDNLISSDLNLGDLERVKDEKNKKPYTKYELYEKLYFKNRDELAKTYVQKKALNIAKSILLGNFKPLGIIKDMPNPIDKIKSIKDDIN